MPPLDRATRSFNWSFGFTVNWAKSIYFCCRTGSASVSRSDDLAGAATGASAGLGEITAVGSAMRAEPVSKKRLRLRLIEFIQGLVERQYRAGTDFPQNEFLRPSGKQGR